MRIITAAALLIVTVVACTRIVDPPLDDRAVPLQVPAVYARWWELTRKCSGLSGSLSEVTWYQVPGVTTLDEPKVSGYWSAGSNRIVLAGGLLLDGNIVRHEMLHALIGASDHSRYFFLEKCGGVVSCSSGCVAEAGTPPSVDPATVQLASSELIVTAALIPSQPAAVTDDGVFALLITATNPKAFPVVVPVGQAGLGNIVVSYSFAPPPSAGAVVSGSRPGFDIGVTVFAPGETKVAYFDFSISTSLGNPRILPGTYRVTGSYRGKAARIENVVIGP